MSIQIGEKAPDFGPLPGIDGKNYSLKDFAQKLLVVLFSCNHCPYVKAYEGRYKALQTDYSARGVQVVAINANDAEKYPDDGFANMQKRAKDLGYNFPYLHDETQKVARSFGATNTPHAFVLDAERKLRYVGRIDDNWQKPDAVRVHDLRNALDDLIAGRAPKVTSTLPVGCSIKWK